MLSDSHSSVILALNSNNLPVFIPSLPNIAQDNYGLWVVYYSHFPEWES